MKLLNVRFGWLRSNTDNVISPITRSLLDSGKLMIDTATMVALMGIEQQVFDQVHEELQ